MRDCPVCEGGFDGCMYERMRHEVFRMSYKIPDSWPLPSEITWYTCDLCGMIYGDGDFNQAMLNQYYRIYYGYGVNSPSNIERLKMDAVRLAELEHNRAAVIVDFGGAGDDGQSIIVNSLRDRGYTKAVCAGAGDPLPQQCDLIYASHVIEHVYDLPETMERFSDALAAWGLLIMDGPDATGLLQRWKMPILDFNTKHINHFTLRDYLNLGYHHGFELVDVRKYELENAPAYQLQFKRLDVAIESMRHIERNIVASADRLKTLEGLPLNVWGMGDITWHLLAQVNLNVLDYIDNDPAYRGQTYNGKPVQERPTNDAPILIMAQGQRQRLIENIRKAGILNPIIET